MVTSFYGLMHILVNIFRINFNQIKFFILFDNRCEHNGETVDSNNYTLRKVNIFIDNGELTIRKVACLSRWELMESSPESRLIISTEDHGSSSQSETIKSPILHGYLQTYLKKNPIADRIILKVDL